MSIRYYSINKSLNRKVVGDPIPVQNVVHYCDVWNEPKFIGNVDFVRLDFEPIVSNAVLKKVAKVTDLISAPVAGFSLRLLISHKLKSVIEKHVISKA